MLRQIWVGVLLAMWAGCSQGPTGASGSLPPPVDSPEDQPPLHCSPATCASLEQSCGVASDGCGGTLDCGSCSGPDTCEPITCASIESAVCGVISDQCGGTVDCGGCTGEAVCGGGGIANLCGLPPQRASCTELKGQETLDPASGGIQGLRECLGNGWCTDNGYMGSWPRELWGFTESDVWAVGGLARGVALHWDGSSWKQVALPSPEPLRGIWGASPADVWAVGLQGVVLRWNGTGWRRFPAPTTEPLTAVSGTSANDVWLVGPTVALHWDGVALSESPGWTPVRAEPDDEYPPDRASVWAIRADDVVAAGGRVCQRWNGAAWTPTDCGMRRATEVWASGSDDVWVVGEYFQGFNYYSQRAHWDGQKWTTETISDLHNPEFERFQSLWGSASNDVWLNGTWHFDGEKWTRICRRTEQTALWGAPSGRLFGSTDEAGLARLEDEGWTLQAATRFIHPSLGRTATGSTWGIGSNGALIAFDGQRWSRHPGPSDASQEYSFYAPFGTSPDDAWSLSYGGGLYRWNGQRWAPSGPPSGSVSTGWAVSPTEAFVVASDFHQRKLWRWDGQSWSPMEVELDRDELTDMWGSGPNDVWAVGWQPPPDQGSCVECNDLLGVGVAWHWNGKQWRRVYAEPGHYLKGVFGTSRSNVWALEFDNGDSTTAWALRWNGSTFVRTGEFQNTGYLEHLAGTGPEDMWVAAGTASAGLHTRMYHFNGQHWTEQEPLPGRVRAMGAIPGKVTFSTTEDGALYESRR